MNKQKHPPLNEALRLLRTFHDMRATRLAKLLGVSPSYLSQIEKGTKQPNLKLIALYAEILNITSARILRFSEDLQTERVPKGVKSKLRVPLVKMMEALGYE